MQKKVDPVDSRLYFPPSFSLRGVLFQAFISRSFHSLEPSPKPVAFWLREVAICRNNNVRRTKSLGPSLEELIFKSPNYQKRWMLSSIQTKPLHKITRAALPETGRRIDDLYNGQDQTPEFVLISFLRPSSKKEGQAGYSLSDRFSPWSLHRGSKKEAVGKRWRSLL